MSPTVNMCSCGHPLTLRTAHPEHTACAHCDRPCLLRGDCERCKNLHHYRGQQ